MIYRLNENIIISKSPLILLSNTLSLLFEKREAAPSK